MMTTLLKHNPSLPPNKDRLMELGLDHCDKLLEQSLVHTLEKMGLAALKAMNTILAAELVKRQ